MSARPPLDLPKSGIAGASRLEPSPDLRELALFALRGLAPMFDTDRQLFCHRLICTEHGVRREGVSPRYTIMTLLGLKEMEIAGTDPLFDIPAIYASLTRSFDWVAGIGELGLLMWLTASLQPDQLERLFDRFDWETALERYADAREGRTMELSWFLTGLAHAAEVSSKLTGSVADLAVKTYRQIEQNQGKFGLFGHMSTKSSLAGRLRGQIGSFADQVYPVYAISKFAAAFHLENPLDSAIECATAVCRAQGDLGQWWWLYDSSSGQVCSRYPVYSVHQHGMAPMALFALEDAIGQSFSEFIYKGLQWIHGANELCADMIDVASNLIWRCVLPKNRHAKYWEMAVNALRSPVEHKQLSSVKILREQRPYEFGWLLFAFARKLRAGTRQTSRG